MSEVDLAGLIETAKQQARKALGVVGAQFTDATANLDVTKEDRIKTVREASKVLETAEIATILGVSEQTVSAWARDPAKPKRTRKVNVVDGRTGEPVTGERAEVADLMQAAMIAEATSSEDDELPGTGEDLLAGAGG